MNVNELQQELRAQARHLRARSTPLNHIVPLMQRSADFIQQQQAEIEALKKSINEALASIPAYGEQGFYFEHHDINGEYLGHSSIHAEDVVQRIEAILRKASEK